MNCEYTHMIKDHFYHLCVKYEFRQNYLGSSCWFLINKSKFTDNCIINNALFV